MTHPLVEAKSAEAINAATNAAQAVEEVRMVQFSKMLEESEKRTGTMIATAIREVFASDGGKKRYLDQNAIPLICARVDNIDKTQTEMKESIDAIHDKLDEKFVSKERFAPVEKIVYVACAIVLIAFLGAVIVAHIPGATVQAP